MSAFLQEQTEKDIANNIVAAMTGFSFNMINNPFVRFAKKRASPAKGMLRNNN